MKTPRIYLAPMVRAGNLPLRLLCLKFGADLVFSEELIAKKLQSCKRVENYELGTVDFVVEPQNTSQHATVVYQTCLYEAGVNILQIGASNATDALKAAQVVCNDVAGIDLNMGCPQHFSISGGMGAALLKTPEIAEDIIKTLARNITNIPITCKIRLLDETQATIDLLRRLEAAGATKITVHLRRVPDRPRDPAKWDELKKLIGCVNIPLVANGDAYTFEDAVKLSNEYGNGCDVMVARGAIADFSAPFSPNLTTRFSTMTQAANAYLSVSNLCASHFSLDKWFLMQLPRYRTNEKVSKQLNQDLASAKTVQELKLAMGIENITPAPVSRESLWIGCESKRTDSLPSREDWGIALSRALGEEDVLLKNSTTTKRLKPLIVAEM